MREVTQAEAHHLNSKAYAHAHILGTLVAQPQTWFHVPWDELPTRGSSEDKLHALMDEAHRYEGLFVFYGCEGADQGGVYAMCAGATGCS